MHNLQCITTYIQAKLHTKFTLIVALVLMRPWVCAAFEDANTQTAYFNLLQAAICRILPTAWQPTLASRPTLRVGTACTNAR